MTVPRSPFGNLLAYIYLLRVQLLTGGLLLILPFLGLGPLTGPRALFQNLFDLQPTGLFVVTLVAVLIAWAVLLTSRLVLLNGGERFGIQQWWTQNTISNRAVLTALLLSLPFVTAPVLAWRELHSEVSWPAIGWNLVAIAAGMLTGYAIAFSALLLAVLISPIGTHPAAETFPAPHPLRAALDRANHADFLSPRFLDWLRRLIARLPDDLQRGFIDPRPRFGDVTNPGYGLPWSGHWVAFTFGVLTIAVYGVIGYWNEPYGGSAPWTPPLLFLLLLILVLHWIIAWLAFVVDRFRVPLLLALACFAVVQPLVTSRDHLFETIAVQSAAAMSPADAFKARIAPDGSPIVVVATAGGGIQAAAWTTEVLTGLQQKSSAWQTAPARSFADNVTLVSGVSGGAAGAMFFLNGYAENDSRGFPTDPALLSAIVNSAERSSLRDIAWAMTYVDLPRVLIPFAGRHPLFDRGRALERTWRRRNVRSTLSQWRADVREGRRPPAIFSATIAETGEPLMFTTTDWPDDAPSPNQPIRKNFSTVYRGSDIPVSTAVRLASTFPYVSPAARAQNSDSNEHLVDGGYYDNYGIAAAVDWLVTATKPLRASGCVPTVVFITIKSFPDNAMTAPKPRSWFFQSYAPALALVNVRTTTQMVRDRSDLLLLQDLLGKDAAGIPRLRFATFQFPSSGAPESWQMNEKQIADIRAQWARIGDDNADLQQVRCAFERSASDTCSRIAVKGPW